MDPYIYPNTNVLVNKLNVRDEQQLIDVGAQFLFNFSQFIATIILVTYPRWMRAYHGYPSDSLQLWEIWRMIYSAFM